jgi:hypothetical protein
LEIYSSFVTFLLYILFYVSLSIVKDIQYFFAIENIPICQQKWEIYFGVELPWEEIWGRHFNNLAKSKIVEFTNVLLF